MENLIGTHRNIFVISVYVYFFILFTVYILIICSNSTIVCLIWIHKNLHEPMYIFIAALLMNSVLFSTNIYPKLLNDILSDKQIISYSACLLQFFIFYSLGSSEFLLLAVMAYDRYVSICKPLQYSTIMKNSTVTVLLILTCFTLKGVFCNNSINHLYCDSSRAVTIYGVVVLLNLVFFPMLFILFTYAKILIISYQSCGEVRRKAAQTCLPHLLVLINYSCLVTYDIIIVRMASDFPKTARFVMTLQIVMYNPLFNPIIYGLKLREISKHLKRLFFLFHSVLT
uniref:G-protein coupled receptors family 1 profile domain-containing protein n=1 Tax=Anabas testudineus TaxID=64144 RepID=A0A7N5ZTK8_ANATE